MRECIQEGLPIEVLPGPSAVPVALVASGLPVDRWCFVGFLPRKRGQRERLLVGAADAGGVRVSHGVVGATLEVLALPRSQSVRWRCAAS